MVTTVADRDEFTAQAEAWQREWLCVEHSPKRSRVSGSMPLPAWVNAETGRCTECGRAVAPPRAAVESLAAAFRDNARKERSAIVADMIASAEALDNVTGGSRIERAIRPVIRAGIMAMAHYYDVEGDRRG